MNFGHLSKISISIYNNCKYINKINQTAVRTFRLYVIQFGNKPLSKTTITLHYICMYRIKISKILSNSCLILPSLSLLLGFVGEPFRSLFRRYQEFTAYVFQFLFFYFISTYHSCKFFFVFFRVCVCVHANMHRYMRMCVRAHVLICADVYTLGT